MQPVDVSCNHDHESCTACVKKTTNLRIVRIRDMLFALCTDCQQRLKDLL